MSHKTFAQVFVITVILAALLVIPNSAQAGGVCGGTYIVEKGQTLASIAAMCGTTVSAITSANPGISDPLKTGQALTVPGSNYNNPINYYGTPTSINIYDPYPPVSYNGTYIVQVGDTFSSIAARFSVSMNDLWLANPFIWDINVLYIGQVINVPPSSGYVFIPTTTATPESLSYGSVPFGAPYGKVKLINKANGDVYVSLQGTTTDGTTVINEYPVSDPMTVKIPAASYSYVAWVGGIKFEGWFHLGGGSDRTITFYAKKVIVE